MTPLEERISQLAVNSQYSVSHILMAVHLLQLHRVSLQMPPAPDALVADLLEPAATLATMTDGLLYQALIQVDMVTQP